MYILKVLNAICQAIYSCHTNLKACCQTSYTRAEMFKMKRLHGFLIEQVIAIM